MITLFVVVGALLLAMIGSAIINPRNKPETADEERARMMEAIANSVFWGRPVSVGTVKRFRAPGLPDVIVLCVCNLWPRRLLGLLFVTCGGCSLCWLKSAGENRRVMAPHLRPGDLAPATETYQEHNVFGTETGQMGVVKENEPLPSVPRGFTWSVVPRADRGQ